MIRHSTKFLCFSCLLIIGLEGCTGKKKKDNSLDPLASFPGHFLRIEDAGTIRSNWSKSNTVIYQWLAEPDVLHPTNGFSAQRNEVFFYLHMYLLQLDFRTLQTVPGAALSLPEISGDGLRHTFKLRNLKWDNGQPLTARDILFTAKANKCPFTDNPNAKSYWENLSDIIPDDSDPLVFTAVFKHPHIHNLVFWGDFPILQQSFFDSSHVLESYSLKQFDGDASLLANDKKLKSWAVDFNSLKYARQPEFLTGLGPYKIAQWESGQSITLERKPGRNDLSDSNYFEKALPDKIIFVVNRDATSQMLQFKSQVYDASTTLSAKTLLELRMDSTFNMNYHSQFVDTYFYTYIGLNCKPDSVKHKPLFDDARVRKAIALLIPYDEINSIVNKGLNKRVAGPVSFLKPDYNDKLALVQTDLDAAKKLLSEAGWTDSDHDQVLDRQTPNGKIDFVFRLSFLTTQTEWGDMAQLIADGLLKAGLKAELNPLDYPVFASNNRLHDFDMMLASWGQSAVPEDFTQLWHTSNWKNNGSNYCGFGNDASDALIDSIKFTINDSLRIERSRRLQQMVYDEQPMVFLFASLRRVAVHKRFGNIELYHERPGLLLNNLKLLAVDSATP